MIDRMLWGVTDAWGAWLDWADAHPVASRAIAAVVVLGMGYLAFAYAGPEGQVCY